MFNVSVSNEFCAQHYLIGGDFGSENIKHTHVFKIELMIESHQLDHLNYVLDIDKIKSFLNTMEMTFKDKCLNDFEAFKDHNPSIEFFARHIFSLFEDTLSTEPFSNVTVKVWEDNECWASFSNPPKTMHSV